MQKKPLLILIISLGLILLLAFLSFLLSRKEQGSDVNKRTETEKFVSLGLKPRPADPVFGVIPPPQLPSVSSSGQVKLAAGLEVENKIPKEALKSLPPVAPVYKLKTSAVTNKELGQALADSLLIPNPPTRQPDGSLTWVEKDYEVMLKDEILYVFKLNPNFDLPAPSVSSAIVVAEKFILGTNLLRGGMKLDREGAHPVRMDNNEIRKTLNRGEIYNAIEVPITYETELPVVMPYIGNGRSMLVGGDGKLLRMEYRLQELDLSLVGQYTLTDPEKMMPQLQLGAADIILDGVVLTYGAEPPVIQKLVVSSVRVVLLEGFQKDPYLQPVYEFSGMATLKDGSQVPFTSYLQAISLE